MVIAVFDNSSTAEEERVGSEDVLRYYQDRKHVVRELCVGGLWEDSHVEALKQILVVPRRFQGNSNRYSLTSSDICLQRLSLSNNKLTSDSGDSLAHILDSVHTLRELDLSDNKVAASGLKKLARTLTSDQCALQTLNLFNNHLGSSCARHVAYILEQNRSIVSLNLGKNQLKSKECIAKLSTAFCQSDYLQKLDLSHNKMGNLRATQLAPILDPRHSHCPLQELNLADNKLTEHGANEILGAILAGCNTTLTKLNLSNNFWDNDEGEEKKGIKACAIFLQRSGTLQELSLASCRVGDDGAQLLCEGLINHESESALRVLDLGWNCIHDAGATQLAEMIKVNGSLQVLTLASNGIGNAGAQALAGALPINEELTKLDLTGNQIQNLGAVKLAEAICDDKCSLQTLKWEDNLRMTDIGRHRLEAAFRCREAKATWLGRILRQIETRRYMKDINQKLGDEELICICRHLGIHRPNLPYVKFKGPDISNRGIECLAKMVISQNCIPLKRLYLQNTHMGDRGAAAISQALLHNQHMTTLSLSSCEITDEGASFLSNIIRRNPKLERLDLTNNRIGDSGAQKLFQAICDDPRHPTMTSLNLSHNNLTDASLCMMVSFEPLRTVLLGENALTDYGALDLAKISMNSPNLRILQIPGNRMTKKGTQALNMFLPQDTVFTSGDQRPA